MILTQRASHVYINEMQLDKAKGSPARSGVVHESPHGTGKYHNYHNVP